MTTYDFVHLSFAALGGEIEGKTKLQKTIYFLGQLTGHAEDLGYRPHYYGPFSADVAGAVERLKTLNFVEQAVRGRGALNKFGFEVCRHDYGLTEDGKSVAQNKMKALPKLWGRLQPAVGTFKQAGEQNYMLLSIAAKTHFLLGKRGEPTTMQELSRLAARFGWRVAEEEVERGAHFLESIGLVKLVSE